MCVTWLIIVLFYTSCYYTYGCSAIIGTYTTQNSVCSPKSLLYIHMYRKETYVWTTFLALGSCQKTGTSDIVPKISSSAITGKGVCWNQGFIPSILKMLISEVLRVLTGFWDACGRNVLQEKLIAFSLREFSRILQMMWR